MKKNNLPQFINKQIVDMLLQSNQVSAQKVSKDLGWSDDTLRKYLRYENKIPKERREELAKYFNIKYPSKLANYQPTRAIKATYERSLQRQKEKYELRKQKEQSLKETNVDLKSNDIELIKTTLVNLVSEVNKLRQELADFKKENSELKDSIKKLSEQDTTRQAYLVKLLKEMNTTIDQLKLAARFNR